MKSSKKGEEMKAQLETKKKEKEYFGVNLSSAEKTKISRKKKQKN